MKTTNMKRIMACLLAALTVTAVSSTTAFAASTTQNSSGSTVADTSSIEIPGYANLVISEDNPIVDFINPAGNTVYFRYTLEKDGAILYQTDLIQPNQFLPVDLYPLLEKGTYTVRFKIETFDVDTQAPCNGAIQETTVTVK